MSSNRVKARRAGPPVASEIPANRPPAPLLIGDSNGGLSSANVAQRKPVLFISSGRASGAAGAALVESIVRDEKKLFTCCVSLDGEYGQKDICLGVPVTIGKNGWEKIIDFKLNDAEKAAFEKSAAAVRNMNEVLNTL